MTDVGLFSACVVCGEVDADTEAGWSICGTCFRIDDPVAHEPVPPWVVAARVAALVVFIVAVGFLVAALAQVS